MAIQAIVIGFGVLELISGCNGKVSSGSDQSLSDRNLELKSGSKGN